MIVNSKLNGQRPQQSKMLAEQVDLPLEDGQQVINPIKHAIHAQQEMMNIGLRDSGESSSHLHSMMQLQVQATEQNEDGRRAMPVAATPPQDAYGHHGYQKSGMSKMTNASLKPHHEQEQAIQNSINSNRLSRQKANSKEHKPTIDVIRSSRKPNEELVLSAAADEFQVIDTVIPKVAMKSKQQYREEDEPEKNAFGQKVQDGLR